ncbi:MAG TPA: hypothetical protein VIY51_24760 [Xanthobacteraceae bacterium]
MRTWKALAAPAIVAAVGVIGITSALANERGDRSRERGGFVQPCSLVGVNPAYHPEIFGNAAAAAAYGFVQGPGRTWQVRGDCRR